MLPFAGPSLAGMRGWDSSGRIRSDFIQAVSLLPFAGPLVAGMTGDEISLDESGVSLFRLFHCFLLQDPHWLEWQRMRFLWTNQERPSSNSSRVSFKRHLWVSGTSDSNASGNPLTRESLKLHSLYCLINGLTTDLCKMNAHPHDTRWDMISLDYPHSAVAHCSQSSLETILFAVLKDDEKKQSPDGSDGITSSN